jgi:hypothetical protein
MGDISLRGRGIARTGLAKGSLPDLTGDGKVTRADVLKGRGVFKKGGTTMPSIPPYLKKGMKKIGLKDGGQTKISKVMKEFKSGELHSGKKGPVVKSRKQAIAIALSEAGKSKMAKGGKPGLWANINARKKAGTSRSKSESTISPKAYANMKAGFPKKKK